MFVRQIEVPLVLDSSVISAVCVIMSCCALHGVCEAKGEPFAPEWTYCSDGLLDWYTQLESALITTAAGCTWVTEIRDAVCSCIIGLHG